MAKRKSKKHKRLPLTVSVVVLLAALCYGVFTGTIPLEKWISGETKTGAAITSGLLNPDAEVAIHFIDVGQGDSVYIKAYDKNILIDAGEKETTQTDVL